MGTPSRTKPPFKDEASKDEASKDDAAHCVCALAFAAIGDLFKRLLDCLCRTCLSGNQEKQNPRRTYPGTGLTKPKNTFKGHCEGFQGLGLTSSHDQATSCPVLSKSSIQPLRMDVTKTPQESTHTNPSVSNCAPSIVRTSRPKYRAQLPLTASTVTRTHRLLQCQVTTRVSVLKRTQLVSQHHISETRFSDSQPGAPDVPTLAVETGLTSGNKPGDCITSVVSQDTFRMSNTKSTSKAVMKDTDNFFTTKDKTSTTRCCEIGDEINDSEMDGHYFLKVLRAELQRLTAMVNTAEKQLREASRLPEHAQGKLRAASGQGRLLITKKLMQFQELCIKNINQSPNEAFPTTSQDLAGFWDVIKLQIDHIDQSFKDIDRLRKAGWVEGCNDVRSTRCANTGSRARQRSKLSSAPGNRTKGMSVFGG